MKLEFNLSDKDKKLLMLLASLAVLSVAFFLIYLPNINKSNDIKKENNALQTRVNELSSMEAQSADKEAQTKEFEDKTKEIEAKFPAGIYQEDVILMLIDLELAANMDISSVTFLMNEILSAASTDGTTPTTTTVETPAPTATATAETTAPAATAESSATGDSNVLTGYKSTITIAYQTTYAGLKRAIDFINLYPSCMSIGDVTAAFDSTTGNLTGTFNIYIYTLSGTEKGYTIPNIDNIKTGLDNIFGTVEN